MSDLLAIVVSTCFAAGLSVPATVGTIGLVGRFGVIVLPGSLEPLTSWWVIGAAAAVFLVEFVADKIPAFDLIWNALQTFIRVPAGALLAYAAAAQLSAGEQLLVTALGAAVALVAHAGKATAHVAVNASPEPFSTVLVSLAEDALAIGLTWLATEHPLIAAAIVVALIAVVVVAARVVIRSLRALLHAPARVT